MQLCNRQMAVHDGCITCIYFQGWSLRVTWGKFIDFKYSDPNSYGLIEGLVVSLDIFYLLCVRPNSLAS